MSFSKLQYITDSPALAHEACVAGVKWVQARIKNKAAGETKIIAQEILSVCRKFNSVCIINDHLEIALEINADGVHLGKEDTEIREAKKIIGQRDFILGGTANTVEDVRSLALSNVKYIGLGPFRFTSTKEKLSPVLGIEGYKKILSEIIPANIYFPPIYAIGGILPADVEAILGTGIYGVAVSGVISNAANKKEIVEEFNLRMNAQKINT
ncbi:MAG: thiamine phosphate synthase [Bacteroidia bacterium]|nr:thiamine phosphate synthase [Bacteroidia bacterium]